MRFRPLLSAAALVALAASPAAPIAHAQPADTTGLPFVQSIHTLPLVPCPDVPTRIVVKGVFPTGCGRVMGHDGLTINVADPYPACAFCLPDSVPWSDTLHVGQLAAGTHQVQLRMNVIDWCLADTTKHETRFTFTVGADCEPGDLVSSIQVFGRRTGIPCPGDSLLVQIDGVFPSDCFRLRKISVVPTLPTVIGPPRLRVVIDNGCCLERACIQQPVPWRGRIMLPPLPTGTYQLATEVGVVCCADTFDATTQPKLWLTPFRVLSPDSCPPPPNDPLRYIDFVRVSPLHDSTTAILCPDDSLRVTVGGSFPDQCKRLRRIDVIPNQWGPLPEPPVLRFVFDNLCCAAMICLPGSHPWQADVLLPPLPTRDYSLVVQAVEVCCTDSVRPEDPVYTRVRPFAVMPAESCGIAPPYACLWPGWDHSGRVGGCDAFLDHDPAAVDFSIQSTRALAGLQGTFHATSDVGGTARLEVASIEPIGPAAGMRLTWEREPGGARFVLFAEHGAPIPPGDILGAPVPVLRIRWVHGPTIPEQPDPARKWFVFANDVFGSDEHGVAVPLCPIRNTRIAADAAVICAPGARCDLNGDALADVRDLVLMAHCLAGVGPCPPDPATALDCEGDQDFDLADVICCARAVLGAPPCPGCADSLRAEPTVGLAFGAPVRTETGYDIPVRIAGAERIGAARFAFRLPEALAGGASLVVASGGFLPIEQHETGRLVCGLIGLIEGTPAFGPVNLDVTLRIAVPSGVTAEGRITVEDVELSGPDGVRLAADLGAPAVRLGPGVSIALSPARPNPFRTGTTFRLTLDAAADVDVGIYDLAGRRVATVTRGALPVGVHTLTWDGRGEAGRVPAGVYFVRAGAPGSALVQKLILVRE